MLRFDPSVPTRERPRPKNVADELDNCTSRWMRWAPRQEKLSWEINHVEVCPLGMELPVEITKRVGEDGGGRALIHSRLQSHIWQLTGLSYNNRLVSWFLVTVKHYWHSDSEWLLRRWSCQQLWGCWTTEVMSSRTRNANNGFLFFLVAPLAAAAGSAFELDNPKSKCRKQLSNSSGWSCQSTDAINLRCFVLYKVVATTVALLHPWTRQHDWWSDGANKQ